MVDALTVVYACADLCLALQIALSNLLVIWVYLKSRHVRTPTNTYIFSLAITDFFAGALGIPLTVFSVLTRKPRQFLPCLAVNLCLCILCTVSTFHLLAIAVDKYFSICYKRCQLFDQHHASRHKRSKTLIAMAWILGTIIGSMPLYDAFGFATNTIRSFNNECHFTKVVDYGYLVYVIFFGTIIVPTVVIAFCYTAIYSKIRREERQIKCLLRAAERQRRINNRRKIIRIMLILVFTYAICWYPLYLLNTIDFYFPPDSWLHSTPFTTLVAVVLSHLNCAFNPLIYAYGVPGFKHSLRRFLPFNDQITMGGSGGLKHYYRCETANGPTSPYYSNNNTHLHHSSKYDIEIEARIQNNVGVFRRNEDMNAIRNNVTTQSRVDKLNEILARTMISKLPCYKIENDELVRTDPPTSNHTDCLVAVKSFPEDNLNSHAALSRHSLPLKNLKNILSINDFSNLTANQKSAQYTSNNGIYELSRRTKSLDAETLEEYENLYSHQNPKNLGEDYMVILSTTTLPDTPTDNNFMTKNLNSTSLDDIKEIRTGSRCESLKESQHYAHSSEFEKNRASEIVEKYIFTPIREFLNRTGITDHRKSDSDVVMYSGYRATLSSAELTSMKKGRKSVIEVDLSKEYPLLLKIVSSNDKCQCNSISTTISSTLSENDEGEDEFSISCRNCQLVDEVRRRTNADHCKTIIRSNTGESELHNLPTSNYHRRHLSLKLTQMKMQLKASRKINRINGRIKLSSTNNCNNILALPTNFDHLASVTSTPLFSNVQTDNYLTKRRQTTEPEFGKDKFENAISKFSSKENVFGKNSNRFISTKFDSNHNSVSILQPYITRNAPNNTLNNNNNNSRINSRPQFDLLSDNED